MRWRIGRVLVSHAEDRELESQPSQNKPMTYKTDTFNCVAWCSALIEQVKDWLAQHQDKVTLQDVTSWCQWHGLPMRQHYKVAMCAHCRKSGPFQI